MLRLHSDSANLRQCVFVSDTGGLLFVVGAQADRETHRESLILSPVPKSLIQTSLSSIHTHTID